MCPCAFSRAPSCAMNGTCGRCRHSAHCGAQLARFGLQLRGRRRVREGIAPAARRARTPGSPFGSRAPSATSPPTPHSSALPSAAATAPATAHGARHRSSVGARLRRAASNAACCRPVSVRGGSRYSGWSYGLKPASPGSGTRGRSAERATAWRGRVPRMHAPLCPVFTPSSLHTSASTLWKPWPWRMKWTCGRHPRPTRIVAPCALLITRPHAARRTRFAPAARAVPFAPAQWMNSG